MRARGETLKNDSFDMKKNRTKAYTASRPPCSFTVSSSILVLKRKRKEKI
jgi:hypothetical protein